MNLLGTNLVLSVVAAMPLLFIQTDQAIASHVVRIVAVKESRICFYNKRTLEKVRACHTLKPVKLEEYSTMETSPESHLEI